MGTGCFENSKSPKAKNWKENQLCYKCYCILILGKKPKKGHGGKYLKESPHSGGSMISTQF